MRVKRFFTMVLVASVLLSGCQKGKDQTGEDKETTTASTEATTLAPTFTPTPTYTPTPTPTPTPKIENISNNKEGHYTFNPHVFGSKHLETFGDEKCQAFFRFCDAVRNGEDTFDCPDDDTYGWCIGNFSFGFCPLASVYVVTGNSIGEVEYENGKGKIFYTIPKEEYLEKQKKFEKDIEDVLNDCLSDDYSDFEKALALYEYMTKNFKYDYSKLENLVDRSDELSVYRCLNEKQGICCELASLYSYLLLQAGVDSNEIGGFIDDGDGTGDAHSWVFVTIDGQSYHIDPTWGGGYECTPLNYFMMTDELRETRDNAPTKEYQIGGQGDESRKNLKFEATDDKYSDLWDGLYLGMNREEHYVLYEDKSGAKKEFHYAA
ncbi:MAG: transglutaminase domain-containing protein [Clostridiales bacterium]|nr:transglutaminase domain-containing protein [Clostridiales bacterium]